MLSLIKNILGDSNERELKRLQPLLDRANSLEAETAKLNDSELRAKTDEFQARLGAGESLDDLLPEAFAVVREAAKRTIGMRHFDVQILGGIVLHQGRIAEMQTGEGKTLVATMPAYLNALTGKGVHIVTVNDYLAKRDREWMGPVYEFLGLSMGLIIPGMNSDERRHAYMADVIYGTNNEFGFDYLRDNMALRREQLTQRELNYAIIDEVDSILIDEARTPLIISGQAKQSSELYYKFARLVQRMKRGEDDDYTVDEKAHTVVPTEKGIAKVEKLLGIDRLYDDQNLETSHHLIQALKAKELMKRDRDYIVKDDEVIIVDQFTGRLMFGRRFSEGLHQAIEAKEGVRIKEESQTLATITFQNYFRMYNKLAGMTGTAKTEEDEFREIYGMDVVVIPTNKPLIREQMRDVVYRFEKTKFDAVVEEIEKRYKMGQPVLVGTVSIEKSELLSSLLKQKGIPHEVLNAKHHEREAEIVARAGQPYSVTIATNMAGRGTDIVLGEGIAKLGGLHVIGTERHESRRIDNQLRGRAGRQGDPGSSQFFLSLEDDLMRLFGSDNMMSLMDRLGIDEDVPIENKLVTRAIESAQKKVEARNFDIRRQVLRYDDIMNKQRAIIYEQRRMILEADNLEEYIFDMLSEVVEQAVEMYVNPRIHRDEWDLAGLVDFLEAEFLPQGFVDPDVLQAKSPEQIKELLVESGEKAYHAREQELGTETLRELERAITLRVVDRNWMDHLDAMDQLRQGIGLRAIGQKDPLMEYQFEAYDMFHEMVASIQRDVLRYLFRVKVTRTPAARQTVAVNQKAYKPESDAFGSKPEAKQGTVVKKQKVGRNDPCPCGSGKKYKKCCGRSK